MPSYFDSQGQSISLSKNPIGKGGEGTVWTTNRKGYLAKIYHKISQEQARKLELMIANPPKNPTAGQNHISISWPTDLIKDHQKRCVGFLMPQITDAKEMICVYLPANRIQKAPRFNWYCLHIIALNFISIIKEIHDKNYIIGDINTKNILVNDRSLVSLIDTDSFQVTESQTGNVYRCSVGVEGFIPPELIGKDLSKLTQTRYHDRFRLGVMIYYLLFGYHPFMGKWSGSGDPPGQNESISKGYWPYGNNSLLKPSQNTIPIDVVHPELEKCFLKCFNDGHQSPSSRPSPENWLNALQLAINDLVICSKNKNHIYSKHCNGCYWCDRAKTLKVDIFPSVKNPIHPPLTSQPQSTTQLSPLLPLYSVQPTGKTTPINFKTIFPTFASSPLFEYYQKIMNNKQKQNMAANQVKSTLNDAIQGLKIFLINPVGGLPIFFQGLGEKRALGVGITFGVAYVLCIILAFNKFESQGWISEISLFNLVALSITSFLSIVGASFVTRKLFRGAGSIKADIFIAGTALIPISLFILISYFLGLINLEIIAVFSVIGITYTILMIYTGCHQISKIPENGSALAVSVMLILSGWLFKILVVSNLISK